MAWGTENHIATGIFRQPINMITTGDNILIPADSGFKIILTSLFLLSKGTVDIRFKTGTSTGWLSGPIGLIANTGFVLPEATKGWMETVLNEQLTLNLSTGIQISGHCSYMKEVA